MANIRFDFPTAGAPTTTLVLDPSLVNITRTPAYPIQEMAIALSGQEWVRVLNSNIEIIWEIDVDHLHEADSAGFGGFTSLASFIQTTINFSKLTFEITDADAATLVVRYLHGIESFQESGGEGGIPGRAGQFSGTLVCRKTL